MEFLISFLDHCWRILLDASPFMLLGFVVAGLLKGFLPSDFVGRHLGSGRRIDVFKAAALGAPLPLCSCGVIPAAAGLRSQGAGKGATASFLISTPETGVDSVAVTWALLDPFMTVIRPLAAVFTAIAAGLAIESGERRAKRSVSTRTPEPAPLDPAPGKPLSPEAGACGCSGCGCSAPAQKQTFSARFRSGMDFAFGELLGDIGLWFLLGVALAGAITAFLPGDFIPDVLGTGLLGKLAALAVATPLYVCATASTPIAAALVLKGFTPGAALIFLLAGPATNAASLTMVAKVLGKRSAVIYLVAILACSLVLGVLADMAYTGLGLDVSSWDFGASGEELSWFSTAMAVLLLGLILRPLLSRFTRSSDHEAHG